MHSEDLKQDPNLRYMSEGDSSKLFDHVKKEKGDINTTTGSLNTEIGEKQLEVLLASAECSVKILREALENIRKNPKSAECDDADQPEDDESETARKRYVETLETGALGLAAVSNQFCVAVKGLEELLLHEFAAADKKEFVAKTE